MRTEEVIAQAQTKADECGMQWLVRAVHREVGSALSFAGRCRSLGHGKLLIYSAGIEEHAAPEIIVDVYVRPSGRLN